MITTTDEVISGGGKMISSDGIRGYNDVIILSVLKDGDSYGYAVSQKIRDVSGEIYVIKETTLYSAFNRLEKMAISILILEKLPMVKNERIIRLQIKDWLFWKKSGMNGSKPKKL